MTVIRSGFSDARTANTAAKTAPPEAPKNVSVDSVSVHGSPPDELAAIRFQFEPPERRIHSAEDAAMDDVYDAGTIIGHLSAEVGTNDMVLPVFEDLTSFLSPGSKIVLQGDTTRYTVTHVDASNVYIQYGLQFASSIGTSLIKLTKLAESPITSREFRVDATIGSSVYIYTDDGITKSKWNPTSFLGNWEDVNKVCATIEEANRKWTARRAVIGATPLMTTTLQGQGDSVIAVTMPPGVAINVGDKVGFALLESDIFYSVFQVEATPSVVILTNELQEEVKPGSQVWIENIGGATPYVFPRYDLININGVTAFTDIGSSLGGYRIYASATPVTQIDRGTLVETIKADDSGIVSGGSAGIFNYTFKAKTTWFDGRRLFMSMSAYDTELPIPNESEAAINLPCLTFPGQAHILEFTENRSAMLAVVKFEKITQRGDGSNSHLLEVMESATSQYSPRGGYDLFMRTMTPMSQGAGVYEGINATIARYSNSQIQHGDQVRIVDGITRHEWIIQAESSGTVTFDDEKLTFGETGSDYMKDHKIGNISSFRSQFNRDTDSVLPLSMATPATPQRQYLTDFHDTATIQIPSLGLYAIAMESVDTEA